MLQDEEEVQKISDFIKKKGFQLNNSEIEKISYQLLGVASFLVRLKIKKHTESLKLQGEENKPESDKPP